MNVDERWAKHNKKLNSISNDISFLKHPYFKRFIIMPLKRNTEMCLREIDILLNNFNFNDKINVLEVGAGFGNFCRLMHNKCNINNYTILDTPSMIRFSSSFLNHHNIKCNFITSENYENVFNLKFDLFVSNICISETPEEYRENLLENVFPNCKNLYMIDGCKEEYNIWLKNKIKKHFNDVSINPISYEICLQKHQNLYIGKN